MAVFLVINGSQLFAVDKLFVSNAKQNEVIRKAA